MGKKAAILMGQNVNEAEAWRGLEENEAHMRMSEAAKAQKQGVENFPHPEDTGKGKLARLQPSL
ncbi:MAG TPA: hypothetical protein VGL94_20870 [Ktedonobacteraceae bacterium]